MDFSATGDVSEVGQSSRTHVPRGAQIFALVPVKLASSDLGVSACVGECLCVCAGGGWKFDRVVHGMTTSSNPCPCAVESISFDRFVVSFDRFVSIARFFVLCMA